jgi:hypothetical protein
VDPNSAPGSDAFPQPDALQDILAAADRNRQFHAWMDDLRSPAEESSSPELAATPSDCPHDTNELSPNFAANLVPSLYRRTKMQLRSGAVTSLRILRRLQAHRDYIYLLVSAILLAVVVKGTVGTEALVRAGNEGLHRAAALSHRVAIELGIADPPQSVEAAQPEARVWVDFSSRVYYCPGNRKYGKTRHGQFTTEASARLSQYEPASHKLCQ